MVVANPQPSHLDLDGLSPPFVLLEDRTAAGGGRLFQAPVAVVTCDRPNGLVAAFEAIGEGLARGFHAAGFATFEAGLGLEPRLSGRSAPLGGEPMLWFGLFPAPTVIDGAALDAAFALQGPPPPIEGLSLGHDRRAHVAKVRRILELIAAGDVYQVNLTFPALFDYAGAPLALYAALRARQPVAHGGVVILENLAALSVSPELWIEVEDGAAVTRPMKGTAPRGMDAEADRAAVAALRADPKQRAENLMIVDLLRNDLARVSVANTVRVPALFTPETYPSFHALTSTVTSRLRPGVALQDVFAALFPCGSIVGAPKIRAAEIIGDLETEPRGLYTGGIGEIAPGGDMRFNVAIRTAVITPQGRGRYGMGGGVVADSDPDTEYDEALLKARVLTDLAEDFGLIETFRWSADSGYGRLGLHLGRLTASAAKLGFIFDPAGAESTLAAVQAGWDRSEGDRRVRLELARGGGLTLTSQPITAQPDRPLRLSLATARLDAGDPFLRHKTTRRAIYETAFAQASAAGYDEAVFLNRSGQLAEASRNTLFLRLEGRLVTPALHCGVLPGVLRAALLADGSAVEVVLTPDDLARASGLFVGNSLHGLRPAVLEDIMPAGR